MADFSKNNENEIKFANWNDGYIDLFTEIKEIRAIGSQALFDINNEGLLLNQYYARISGLFSTHGHYVKEEEMIQRQLDKIEQVLFSKKYLNSIHNGTNVKEQQIKIITDLRKFFKLMCESFSANGLTMKVIIKKRKASKKENLTDEEREELEALEEVGIM